MNRYALLASLALLLGLGIPLLLGGWEAILRLQAVAWWVYPAGFALVAGCWLFNGARLRVMLGALERPMPMGRAVATIMATDFAICATPAASGGPLTFVHLLHRHGLPVSRAAALYALHQLLDLFFFLSALLPIALFLIWRPGELHLAWPLAALAGLLSLGLGLAWAVGRWYRPVLVWGGPLLRRLRVAPERRRRLARGLLRFRATLRFMFSLPRSRLLLLYSLCTGHWLLRYSILYLIVLGLGDHIDWAYGFLVQMLALSAGQLSLLPGGSGGVELGFSALLAPYLDGATLGATLLLWRFFTYWWYLIAGAPVFAHLAGRTLWRHLAGRRIP